MLRQYDHFTKREYFVSKYTKKLCKINHIQLSTISFQTGEADRLLSYYKLI